MAGHRRVEPRTGLAGTGMATDVDRLKDLDGEVDRRARAWRDAPAKGFGDVLEEAPPRGELEEEEHADPRRRPTRPAQVPSEVEMAAAAQVPPAPANPSAAPPASTSPPQAKSGPRLPPDPRAAALHRRMQQKVLQEPLLQEPLRPEPPRPPSSGRDAPAEPARIGQGPGETPPTGNPGQRNRRP